MTTYVDNSILEAVAKCSTQALMRYHYGYATDEGMNKANAGKVWHSSNEVWFSTWDETAAMVRFDQEYDRLLGEAQQGMEPKDPLQRENLKEIALQYYRAHPQTFWPFEPIVRGIEKVHAAPLMDGVMFFGLVDLPCREKKTGALYVCDHKTRHGYINEWWTKKFALGSQLTGYVWVLEKLYGESVPGVYINALAVQKLPDPTSTRCRVHKRPYKECRLQHANWELFIVGRSPELLAQWEVDAKGLARWWLKLTQAFPTVDMVKYAQMEGTFTGACVFCDFKKFCRAGRAEAMANSLYKIEHWRPWEEK